MASQDAGSVRSARLAKYFDQVLKGARAVRTMEDGKRFIEGICDQSDVASTAEKLIASPEGINSLQRSLRLDIQLPTLNGLSADLVNYLADDTLKHLCNGQYLQKIIAVIVEPPTFWNALVEAQKQRTLSQNALQAFAWLLLELLTSNGPELPDVRSLSETVTTGKTLLGSSVFEIRVLGEKIKHALLMTSANTDNVGTFRPGGRHDNDFEDFRKISILPTADEMASTEEPYYLRAETVDEKEPEVRGGVHLDNQFRLLREDFMGELRTDLKIARGQKSGRGTNPILKGLILNGILCDPEKSWKYCCLTFQNREDPPQLRKLEPAGRLKYLKENRNFIKHQSFGCIMDGNNLISFANVERDEELLAKKPMVLTLRILGETGLTKTLIAAKTSTGLKFVQVNTAVFAFEPILKCLQAKSSLPLVEELFYSGIEKELRDSTVKPAAMIQTIREYGSRDLQGILGTPKSIELDNSQLNSLIMGLERRLSLIQGPPGTGKSFIGALIAKILHRHTEETILVICYTNHALDQFLEDLIDIGIPEHSMVRLGSKSTLKTEHLSISNASKRTNFRRSQASWDILNGLKREAGKVQSTLSSLIEKYCRARISQRDILEYLEFSDTDERFFYAFSVPSNDDGMTTVGAGGKAIAETYLLDLWESGKGPGIFAEAINSSVHASIWAMSFEERNSCLQRWILDIITEQVTNLDDQARKFDASQELRQSIFNERDVEILRSKRIIGCTTTAAAMYAKQLTNASPGIILVEEAGEILESHVLTALTPNTKQIILIGDHKQLRPKVNNYALTVEKDDGYNLNVSLFERLVLAGVPHTTLSKQHRMCPEISSFVRHLTYDSLLDAPGTMNRPLIRGLQDRVVFLNHNHWEVEAANIADKRDEGSKTSKTNAFEVEMVLSCVRYLGQQGYGTDKLVVLTPYLGQLRLLVEELGKTTDPILNDLDSFDLVRAGLLPAAASNGKKRPIKISTVDNYQGEESEIVIASLTRSNKRGDIGFMSSPQRLNVLLSRARNGLILIGNANTFMESRKGKPVWSQFFEHLQSNHHLYDGLPVRCVKHPDKLRVLQTKKDFDLHCPDGGCEEPCGIKLNCGVHDCPQRCHQLEDHSLVQCQRPLKSTCPKKHELRWKCYQKAPGTCRKCDIEAEEAQRKKQRDHQLEIEREAKQLAYAKELAEIQVEKEYYQRLEREKLDDETKAAVIAQHRKDLEDAKQRAKLRNSAPEPTQQLPPTPAKTPPTGDPALSIPTVNAEPEDNEKIDASSVAKDDWEYQKDYEGATNDALDSLINMTGLENVKQQFLDIKVKVDTVVRQGTDLKGERFGAAFLGNPGTGKTTVARLYSKFLASVGAIPGSCFVETSGARLSNDGIGGCKKHIEEILNSGGGALFIDEAYQLVSSNNPGGSQVLDFLLAEMENLTGRVVFILAGYNKQMEGFFAHNPGLPSRIPYQLQFEDYTDSELQQILQSRIKDKYRGAMKVEEGFGGLYMRVVARRIGRGRGRDGFGNARAVHNSLAKIADRQAKRLQKQRRAKQTPDDMMLNKEDLLGPEPSSALKKSKAWTELQSLIGLKSVKGSVGALFDSIKANYDRELEEKPLVEYSLNKVFFGSPGTGKTSVGKLYGQILADIGFLSSGEVVVKNPADFVGNVLGGSESQTKGILAATVGKVLIIDEAYMLATGGNSTGAGSTDIFKTAVIDTIVAEVQSTPGEDRCVLLLGYKDQMEEMFQNVNPGLSRRFPISSGFFFEDFTDDELRLILNLKLKKQGFDATNQGKAVAMDVLRRARNKPHFGNAGEVDILLDKAKATHQKRFSSKETKLRDTLEPKDFDEDFDRGQRASTNIQLLFKDTIGCEAIIQQLEGYQNTTANMKALGMDPREVIPFNFLFRGPPGTGKTTTARRMGKVYYDMGFLATAEVIECSSSELIGEYLGHTGPKTQKQIEKALGKVLFIDEAYRLADGQFAKEAMDEIVACLTNPKFAQKLIVILAGYDNDINRLMSKNPGLTSRFPEAITFANLSPEECLSLLTSLLKRYNQLDTTILRKISADFKARLCSYFESLTKLPAWGNARDIQSLAKGIFKKAISTIKPPVKNLTLTEDLIIEACEHMISERSHRAESTPFDMSSLTKNIQQMEPQPMPGKTPPAQSSTSISTATEIAKGQPAPEAAPPSQAEEINNDKSQPTADDDSDVVRDAGVSDAVWNQLQQDKQAAENQAKEQDRILQSYEKLKSAKEAQEQKEAEEGSVITKEDEDGTTEEDEYARRMLEQARLDYVRELEETRKKLEELARQKRAIEEERKKQMKVQAKLREMGVCSAGFSWIKQLGGYRCAGGYHFVSDGQLGM